jgi:hypothetical protein
LEWHRKTNPTFEDTRHLEKNSIAAMQLRLPTQNPKDSKRVSFNEAELAEHDKDRGTRMVIPDPDTPFMRSPVMSDDEDSPRMPRHRDPGDVVSRAAPIASPTVSDDIESEVKKREFAEKRKWHYNEYRVLKGEDSSPQIEPNSPK